MHLLSRHTIAASLAAVTAAATLIGGVVLLNTGTAVAKQNPAGAQYNTVRAGTVISTTVVTESVPFVYSNTGSWQTLVKTTVPKGGSYLLVRWSASSRCRGMAVGWCSARILVNGTPAQPDNDILMPFDYTKYPRDGFEYLTMEKVAPAAAGDASVDLQINPTQGSDTTWDLAGWTLTIQVLAAA